MQLLVTSIGEVHQRVAVTEVTSEHTSFGKQWIVLQLWGSAQLSGWLLGSPVS